MPYALKVAWHMLVTTPRYVFSGDSLSTAIHLAWMFRPLSQREIEQSGRIREMLDL